MCVGLDSDVRRIPKNLSVFEFNKQIIDATCDYVCAYKPNSAFYEQLGEGGMGVLKHTVCYIKEKFPEIAVILDAKRGDIGNTNNGYVISAFDDLGVDAITVSPYLGKIALEPFLERADKGIIVLAKTSNEGSWELQNKSIFLDKEERKVFDEFGVKEVPLYLYVAWKVKSEWNRNGNCGLVVGATYPQELKKIRDLGIDLPILIPGVGTQGGDLNGTIEAGKIDGFGMIISMSREVIFASSGKDFAEAAGQRARELNEQIKFNL